MNKFKLTTMLFCCLTLAAFSQENYKEAQLLDMYENYTELPREVAFVHLNKSVYVKGELMAFQAYVLDKNTRELSSETANLYITISDTLGHQIKKKLFRVYQGSSHGSFEIDSLFTGGQYVIKAYTNWMRNFKEQNFYIQNFKVLDPEDNRSIIGATSDKEIDAQFLPVGGHMVANIKNTVGVTLKDAKGFGLSGIKGKVVDENKQLITTFKTNDLGFSKFYLSPATNKNYYAVISINGKEHEIQLDKPENQGIVVELQDLRTKVALAFRTNEATAIDRRRGYQLAIHNGANLKITEVAFAKNALEVLKVIPYNDLDPGLNIFTLLDQYNEPILERLFFKHDGLLALKANKHQVTKEGDSLVVRLGYQQIDTTALNAVSISVLPKNTQSYTAHHSLRSYTSLQPYVRGYIENARYYFEEITPKRNYDLDLLLMNQGWSSYNWRTVFNDPPDYNYDFENGIGFTANLRDRKGAQLLRYPNQGGATEIINLSTDETAFQRSAIFPIDGDKIRIGEILPDGKVVKPSLNVLFNPSAIPALNVGMESLFIKEDNFSLNSQIIPDASFERVEKLDEVILTEKKAYTRIEKLRNATSGKVEVFDEDTRVKYRYFSNYISQRGYIVDEGYYEQIDIGGLGSGMFRIVNRIQSTLTRGGAGNVSNTQYANNDEAATPLGTRDQITSGMIPTIYLDGILLADLSILYRFEMSQVDYIEVDRYGLGGGMRGGGGIIKIFTDPSKVHRASFKFDKTYEEYALPLTFSKPSRYYTPKYNSYTSNFFRDYGVVGWFPQLHFNALGELIFKIPDTGAEVLQLGIEGLVNNGTTVSEILEVVVN
ncbi:hypothetical protein [Muriicola sp. Z0-33]|uniref:hypothetical protein n=1 Tax=Muriicola sp. Z0-33 TaxID=2816957 RepID=UPI0022385D1A|nr:hypothetical protein [Muriicola sp. Z0-33]MCW5517791.1 hypothetical protein [Muriicola sp. Z0-33]